MLHGQPRDWFSLGCSKAGMAMRNPAQIDLARARRAVSYELEYRGDTWTLMAVDHNGQKYLVCNYEDQEAAEQALRNVRSKQEKE